MLLASSSTAPNQTLASSSIFLESWLSYSNLHSNPPPPLAFLILSGSSSLPPPPSDFPRRSLIPGTRFVIDEFRSAGDFSVSYFLSHFHSDHYAGLGPQWTRGIVFCSETTAQLLIHVLEVPPVFVVALPLGVPVEIDGCRVTLVDANHCPGAVQFLFEVPRAGRPPERNVHTGDFRFCESMKSDSSLSRFVGADAVFLDTTYCNPRFTFPSQEDSLTYVVNTINRISAEDHSSYRSVIFFISTYIVGKEKILLEVSRRCGCSVHVDSKKMRILSILGLAESGVFTEDATATDVHVIGWNILGETWPYFRPNFVKMNEVMTERGYSRAVGFVPTGWMYETKKRGFAVRTKESMEIHLVPYSEHSSYDELREYVRFLKPKRVVPTVGLSDKRLESKQCADLQKHFRGLVDEKANKQAFLMAFHQKSQAGDLGAILCQGESNEKTDAALVQNSSVSSEALSVGKDDLRDLFPSWVTDDQILTLLRNCEGETVKAVSLFFERELTMYEEAHSSPAISCFSKSLLPESGSSLDHDQGGPDFSASGTSLLIKERKTTSMNYDKNIYSPKRKECSVENKPRKKHRSSMTAESTRCKQSTITKYFGKYLSDVSASEGSGKICDADKQMQDAKQCLTVPVEMYKEEVDRLLEIIELPRVTAASLMEKTNGNIDMAVELYYADTNASVKEENASADQSEKQTDLPHCFSDEVVNLKVDNENLHARFVHGILSQDAPVTYVSLPVESYSPHKHACWIAGQPAPYIHMARTFDLLDQEKGKLKTISMLCNMFRSLLAISPEDVLPAVYLCTNKIAPDHENMELNIGGSIVIAALEEACGTARPKIEKMYKIYGDLGDVAQECKKTQSLLASPHPLAIRDLFCMLRNLSVETGKGSTNRKKRLIVKFMCRCREMEMKFLVRTLVHNLRIGATAKTILSALAQAVFFNNLAGDDLPSDIKMKLQKFSAAFAEAYDVLPNLDLLIPSLLSRGIDFSACTLRMVPGSPIPPMLARITNGVSQVLKVFEGRAFTCEYKYDGQRAQIHKLEDGSIRVFSRQLKESSSRFPDLMCTIVELCCPNVLTFILDAEVVAVDRKNGNKLLSFQDLSSRERGSKGSSITLDTIKVDICIFIFDLMFLEGERLLATPLRERRKYLRKIFPEEKIGYLEHAKEVTVEADEADLSNQDTLTMINTFFEGACTSSCEGIMVKSLDLESGYFPSKRTESWLKVKRDYVEGFGDSLDLVPIGAWHGNGRKAGWYSPFLMACYNSDAEEFQSVCRVMTGFCDAFYQEMKELFSGEKILPKKPAYYRTDESPDLWFSSELVWEIKGADLTVSPVHHAAIGLVHPSRGISVRLPRYVRSVPDRKPEECSSAADIACMFNLQARKLEVRPDDC